MRDAMLPACRRLRAALHRIAVPLRDTPLRASRERHVPCARACAALRRPSGARYVTLLLPVPFEAT
ncbi:MAG: hypothetical protein ABI920_19225, partial [Casimicrobiaceae bacterium]